jgi:arginine deiminase
MREPVRLHDEISPLRRVVVHQPGDEIVRMTHMDLERLLFDDLLSPAETALEHQLMAQMLADSGAEVLEIGELLVDALKRAPVAALEQLIHRRCDGPPIASPKVWSAGCTGATCLIWHQASPDCARGSSTRATWRSTHCPT